jgi:hexokinase
MDIQTLTSIKNNFVKELEDAQNGKKTSLPFIVHQLAASPLAKDGEVFQVIKIGGSILQKSNVFSQKKNIVIKTLEEEHLPVLTSKDLFLSIVDKHISPKTTILAINFAFPLKPVFKGGKLDGILVMGTKEHAFQGLVGVAVGETIERYIKSKYNRDIRVSIANDTICLTLAGLTKHPAGAIAGGIVGTGMNFAVFLDDTHLVNLEAANFDKFPQSPEGKQIDAQSNRKGSALYEKEISGGYLYHHFNIQIAKNQIQHPALESTHQMDRIARGNVYKATEIARNIFEHSASLIACQVAGITEFKKRDMTFVMEGSLFWVGWQYKQIVEKYVKILVPKYNMTFEEIKDCGIIGAAKLAT